MTDKVLGFFSGFPNGFPGHVANQLREVFVEKNSLVMIASEISKHKKVDRYAAQWRGWFEDINLPFGAYYVIDGRMEPAQAVRLTEAASCVILMGGDPDMQLRFMCETGLDGAIRNTRAAVLGLSAGAVNMAVRSLHIGESPVPYEGLGLADITVHPHFDPKKQRVLKTLLRVSQELPIFAMEDDSAIFVTGDRISSTGEIHWIHRGEICPFREGVLRL